MTIEELREQLRELAARSDREGAHSRADELLLAYIGDDEVTETFNNQEMWYG